MTSVLTPVRWSTVSILNIDREMPADSPVNSWQDHGRFDIPPVDQNSTDAGTGCPYMFNP